MNVMVLTKVRMGTDNMLEFIYFIFIILLCLLCTVNAHTLINVKDNQTRKQWTESRFTQLEN